MTMGDAVFRAEVMRSAGRGRVGGDEQGSLASGSPCRSLCDPEAEVSPRRPGCLIIISVCF